MFIPSFLALDPHHPSSLLGRSKARAASDPLVRRVTRGTAPLGADPFARWDAENWDLGDWFHLRDGKIWQY